MTSRGFKVAMLAVAVAACGEDKPKCSPGAEIIHGVCDCPPGRVWSIAEEICEQVDGGAVSAPDASVPGLDRGADSVPVVAQPDAATTSERDGGHVYVAQDAATTNPSDADAAQDAAAQSAPSDARADAGVDYAEAGAMQKANACGGLTQLEHEPGAPCSAGVGECARPGVYACISLTLVMCNAAAGPAVAEACDGKDNDCDGMADEGVANECGGCGAVTHHKDSTGLGQPCVYWFSNDVAGDCAARGTGICDSPTSTACSPIEANPCVPR